MLEEYLKRKVLNNIDSVSINKLSLLFYVEDAMLNKMGKKISFKESLNDSYTLDDIAQSSGNSKKGRSLHLLYKIVFDDETVFPEILKTLPNGGFINSKLISKLTRKIRKAKQGRSQVANGMKNEKSMFSLFNHNSKAYDNTFFAGTINNPTDTINVDRYQGFDSNNFLGSKKNSVSFARVHSNLHSQKQNSNNFYFQDFQNIGKLLNSSEIDIKKIDSSKIKHVKKDEGISIGGIGDNSSNINIANSVHFESNRVNGEKSNATKNSVKYDEGLALLYDKIKTFN